MELKQWDNSEKGKSLIKFARENKRYEIEKFIMSLK
jgi:hypothetical protein